MAGDALGQVHVILDVAPDFTWRRRSRRKAVEPPLKIHVLSFVLCQERPRQWEKQGEVMSCRDGGIEGEGTGEVQKARSDAVAKRVALARRTIGHRDSAD